MTQKNFIKKIGFLIVIALFASSCLETAVITPNPNPTESPSTDKFSGQATKTNITPTAKTPLPLTVVTQEPVEQGSITIWHPWSGEYAVVFEELAATYINENEPNYPFRVESHADPQKLIADFNTAIDENFAIPDIIISTHDSLHDWEERLGLFFDFNTYYLSEEEGFNQEFLNSIIPTFWNIDTVNGKRIGIPTYETGYFLFYNQTWAQELGFKDYPKTTDEFQEQICRASINNLNDAEFENNGTGGWIYTNQPVSMYAWMKAYEGGTLLNNRQQPILSEDGNIQSMTFLYDQYINDCAWLGKQTHPYQYFSNRNALAYSGSLEDISRQLYANEIQGSEDNWQLIPYPSGQSKPIVITQGFSYALIEKDSTRSLAAWNFIKAMTQPEVQAQLINLNQTFPVSTEVIPFVDEENPEFLFWEQTLQYLPFVDPLPPQAGWSTFQAIISDLGWQLIQYTTQRENISQLLTQGEEIYRDFQNQQ